MAKGSPGILQGWRENRDPVSFLPPPMNQPGLRAAAAGGVRELVQSPLDWQPRPAEV